MAGLGRIWRGTIGRLTAMALLVGAAFGAQLANAAERKLLVASFENIQVVGDIDVTVQTGKSPSAKAIGDKRMLEALKLERVGTTLRVRLQDIVNNNKGVPITAPLRVTLTTQAIQDIAVSGNGTLRVSEVKQQTGSKMVIAGNGSVLVGRLITDLFSATINGNGKIDIGGGLARDARITIDGAGSFDGTKMSMRKLRLEHIGNAVSRATVEEGTDIYNRGSGNITIGGKGTCFIKVAGSAAINCAKIDSGQSK